MDYRIRYSKAELDSTGYMEIGPGKYTGLHWQDGFIFVWEDAFGVAEGTVLRHYPDYDHMGMNDIPKDVALKIVSEWQAVAHQLPNLDRADFQREMNLTTSYLAGLASKIDGNRSEISLFLRSLAKECENFIRHADWLCILGM